jgi:hypothetical protein
MIVTISMDESDRTYNALAQAMFANTIYYHSSTGEIILP